MKVGTIVQLKVDCLGNKAGSIGVVYYQYFGGFQAIFPNGEYDGFSEDRSMPNGESEADYFLEKIGFSEALSAYQFKNVIRLSEDFRNKVFDEILRVEGERK